jgi:hypothetical protein
MSIWILIAIGIAFFILYWLYTMLVNVSLTKGVVLLNKQTVYDKKNINDEMGDKLLYDGWLFISNTTNTGSTDYVILKREIMIGLNKSSFNVYKRTGESNYTLVSTGTANFPLNKWVYFAVRYSDKILEIYLNGKLVKTKYLTIESELIDSSYKKGQDLKVGQDMNANVGYNGYITKLRRLTDPPDSNYIWQHYLEGNGQLTSMFGGFFANSYQAKVSVFNDSQKTRELTLF